MATMLPKVLEMERHQLADYARVDYAITKGEDEVAALEELWLGPDELRRETSVVRDRTFSLSARFARTWRSAPSQPRTCRGHWSNLYGSVHVLLWRTLSMRVYARAASRVWNAYQPLRSFVTSSTRSRLATLLAPKVFALNFKPAKIGTNMPSPPGLYLRSSRVVDLFRRCDPIFAFHRVEPADRRPDRSRAFDTSLLGTRPDPPREHAIVSVRSAFAA